MSSLELFHLLRPWMLLLLLPAWGFVWWLLRQQNDVLRWKSLVNPLLLKHLLVKPNTKASKIQASHFSASWHLGIVWTLIIIALSGPSWKLKPAAFSQDEAQIVLVLKVTQSMETKDVMPSRLKRTVLKMKDLMEERVDAKMALVAYSGSAHLVLPMTKDHNILNTFAQALDPKIMPTQGDDINAALRLASKQFESKGGTIVVFTDSVNVGELKSDLVHDPKVILFAMASAELADVKSFEKASSLLGGTYVQMSVDNQDIVRASASINTAFAQADAEDNTHYEDGGYWLLPLIILFMALWLRRGFIAEAWRVS